MKKHRRQSRAGARAREKSWDEFLDERLNNILPTLSLAHLAGEELTIIEAHYHLTNILKVNNWTFRECFNRTTETYLFQVMDETGKIVREAKAGAMF